jgi:hypothetical protein
LHLPPVVPCTWSYVTDGDELCVEAATSLVIYGNGPDAFGMSAAWVLGACREHAAGVYAAALEDCDEHLQPMAGDLGMFDEFVETIHERADDGRSLCDVMDVHVVIRTS